MQPSANMKPRAVLTKSAREHALGEVVGEPASADGGLDADRLAGELADQRDLLDQLVHVGDVEVAVRADRVLARRDAANPRDQLRHLGAREHAALAGLRT